MGKIFGIDLGTTNSLIALLEGGLPRIIPDPDTGDPLLPSAVFFSPDGTVIVGSGARRRGGTGPGVLLTSVKRFMGRGVEDLSEDDRRAYPFPDEPGGMARFRVGTREYTPPEISAMILRELKARAERSLKESISSVVITVPAYFNDGQRQATKDAGRLAGLDVVRLLNEPTAASLAYGLQKKGAGHIAVYDLGGGTFDLSILRLREGVFEVLATAGDTRLGGDDIDNRLARVFLDGVRPGLADDPEVWNAARASAETVKVRLSGNEYAEFSLSLPQRSLEIRIGTTRKEFEGIIRNIVDRTVPICRRALKDSGLPPDRIDEVVMVGGSTRIPLVRALAAEIFGRAPHTELNPEEVVAMGAAIEAGVLAGSAREVLLLDVVPLSLGIETFGGVMSRIIERNTTIPTSAKETFTTFADGQTSVDIHVLQGERELARDNRSLARFQLKPLPPLPAGVLRIEVTFLIDASGILHVTAREVRTGREQRVQVTPSYGLSDEQVERMLMESVDHAEEDVTARLLIQARVDGEEILAAARKSVGAGADLLQPDERRAIDDALRALEEDLRGADHHKIQDRIKALDEAAFPLAQRLMDRSIKKALEGKKVPADVAGPEEKR